MSNSKARVRRAIGAALLALVLTAAVLAACAGASDALPSLDPTVVSSLLPLPTATGDLPRSALWASSGGSPSSGGSAAEGAAPAAPAQQGMPVALPLAVPPPPALYLPSALADGSAPVTVVCPAIAGWQGLYWANTTLTGNSALCRDDADLAFNWGNGSPDPSLPADHFSARWTRRVALAAGRYRFHLGGDDGVRLWVDDTLVSDHWQVQSFSQYTVELDLLGGDHNLRVDYFDDLGLAQVALTWELLPSTCSAYQAEYYNNATLTGSPAFMQCENFVIDHDWGRNGPGNGIGANNFSVRWTGRAHLAAGTYTFVANSDDGMRAWLNGELIVNAWRVQGLTEYRVTRTLPAGDYDLRVEYFQGTGRAVAQFYWLLRTLPPGIVISQKQGFDICQLPPPDQMLTWWNQSPYWEANIYMGGSLSFCSQPNLTAPNIVTLHNQGWNFIPTWVGPQAPCTNYAQRMSADANAAHDQGRSEATSAADAAQALGLPALGGTGGSTIVYYDLEYYTGDATCRATVSAFVSGWVERLHELGIRAGMYASPCGGYMADWAGGANMPDDVWPAIWTESQYNPGAGVWGLACLDDSLWNNHQRIRQYAGGHDETWGGLTLNIDSNVIDGHVAGDNLRPVTTTLPLATSTPNLPAAVGGGGETGVRDVTAAGLLPSGQGWALAGNRLLWTADGGGQWTNITPAAAGGPLRAAYFADAQHGWLLLADTNAPGFVLGRTADGGRTWTLAPLAGLAAEDANILQSPAWLDFVDARTGWLALKLPGSSNFSRGLLFGTADGGQTWQPRTTPVAGPVRFVDATTGWVAGGPAGDQLYVTHDSGTTWQRQAPATGLAPGERAYYALPVFRDPQQGALAVTVAGGDRPRVEIYRSADGGRTWQGASATPVTLTARGAPAGPAPAAFGPELAALVADPATGQLWAPAAGRAAAQVAAGNPVLAGVTDLQLGAAGQGWALVPTGTCSGDKAPLAAGTVPAATFRCAAQRALLRTADGGVTWQDISP